MITVLKIIKNSSYLFVETRHYKIEIHAQRTRDFDVAANGIALRVTILSCSSAIFYTHLDHREVGEFR